MRLQSPSSSIGAANRRFNGVLGGVDALLISREATIRSMFCQVIVNFCAELPASFSEELVLDPNDSIADEALPTRDIAPARLFRVVSNLKRRRPPQNERSNGLAQRPGPRRFEYCLP